MPDLYTVVSEHPRTHRVVRYSTISSVTDDLDWARKVCANFQAEAPSATWRVMQLTEVPDVAA